jgi:hypothetical protein
VARKGGGVSPLQSASSSLRLVPLVAQPTLDTHYFSPTFLAEDLAAGMLMRERGGEKAYT